MYRWVATSVAIMTMAGAGRADIAVTEGMRVKDKDGKTLAVLLDCPQLGKDGAAFGGSEDSTIGKDRCGKCLLEANYGTMIRFPVDLHIKGTLLDEEGKPLPNRMLHMFLPNGWTIKSRTFDGGDFRFLLGATAERTSKEPVVIDIGPKRRRKDDKTRFYAMYMMPENFKPCPPAPAKSDGAKQP